jgi:hypothetical protein
LCAGLEFLMLIHLGPLKTGFNDLQRVIFKLPSQWTRGPIHKLFSPAQTPGSRDRISLEGWIFVCACSVSIVLCVGSGHAMG